jgi:hypothetical protein
MIGPECKPGEHVKGCETEDMKRHTATPAQLHNVPILMAKAAVPCGKDSFEVSIRLVDKTKRTVV